MDEVYNIKENVLRVTEYIRPNGQQLSFVSTNGKPVCFRGSRSSVWEPIGQENRGMATAMNRFAVRYSNQ